MAVKIIDPINTNDTPTTLLNGKKTTGHPMQPGQLHVIKRNGNSVAYDPDHITVAMKKAFLAVEGETAIHSSRMHALIAELTQSITTALYKYYPAGGAVHIEAIQDHVELELMRAELHKVARAYVLYREERRKQRERQQTLETDVRKTQYYITQADGSRSPLDLAWLNHVVGHACTGLADVAPDAILKGLYSNLCENNTSTDVYKALIMSVRPLLETEPNYTYVAARVLSHQLYEEVLTVLQLPHHLIEHTIHHYYKAAFKAILEKGIQDELLHPDLAQFDWDILADALRPERDQYFTYLGLQTLYDRYFIRHTNDVCMELPQTFFMRIAMALACQEKENRHQYAMTFYNIISSLDAMPSTPTLFNAGTLHPQLSSCFVVMVPDDLGGIYSAFRDTALMSKFGGGIAQSWTSVRALGARIKGTRGQSSGVIPLINVTDASNIAVNQGGKRKGATCVYLEVFHLDIEAFLELRKNTGDHRRRTHDINTACWIPDLFMQRVLENQDWTLFSPDETPDLHHCYGENFNQHYLAYEAMARNKKIRSKTVSAVSLWRRMLSLLFETGHPWITFKDPCNLRSPQQHTGVVHSSNLCTEITLNTAEDEIAVCNLGSINLVNHIKDGKLDTEHLRTTIDAFVRFLDNVISSNYYIVPQSKYTNLKHRPVGLGVMGFQDALYILDLPYNSDAAVEFADYLQELISYYAILASIELAKERGTYPSYEGSLWSQGILPIDSIELLAKQRGAAYLKQNRTLRLDWGTVRTQLKTYGIRNSNVMAIAPTATIANISGVSPSIEPTYQHLYVKSNLSGEFTVLNPYLVNALKKRKLWDPPMIHDLKYFNGSIQNITRIPQDLKRLYLTAFEIDPEWLVEAASRRQKWIDQSQSLNLYVSQPSGKKLDALYRLAWMRGLKTTYYLRTMGATHTEKATIQDHALNAVPHAVAASPSSCKIDDEDCEACQ